MYERVGITTLAAAAALLLTTPSSAHAATRCGAGSTAQTPLKCDRRGDVCFIAFGDQGTGDQNQLDVGKAMYEWQRNNTAQFVIGMGDNFYELGVYSHWDKQWKTKWKTPYGRMPQRFYMTLGNHDVLFNATSAGTQVRYTKRDPKWYMPNKYYTFRKGNVQFFAIYTPVILKEAGSFALTGRGKHMEWLERELAKSTARWKIVYGHHAIYSYGEHGAKEGGMSKEMVQRIMPILRRYKVDLYISGHEHDQQHIHHPSYPAMDFFVTGTAGKNNRKAVRGRNTCFAGDNLGFMYFRIRGDKLDMRVIHAISPATQRKPKPVVSPHVVHAYSRAKNRSWVFRKSASGQSCKSKYQCRSGRCDNSGIFGYQSHRCIPIDGRGAAGEFCHHNNHCGSKVCAKRGRSRHGTCSRANYLRLGQGCQHNNQCRSRRCDNRWGIGYRSNRCIPSDGRGRPGDFCHHDNHCQSKVCAKRGRSRHGTCSRTRHIALGQPCKHSNQCRSQRCDNRWGIGYRSHRCIPIDGRGRRGDYCHHDNHCGSRKCIKRGRHGRCR